MFLLDAARELGDLVIRRATLCHLRADLAVGVHHRCMVAAAELLTNLWKGKIGEFSAQIHGNLASSYQDAGPRAAAQVVDAHPKVGRCLGNDACSSDLGGVVVGDEVSQNDLRESQVDLLAVEVGERGDPDESAFEFPDVRGDL